MTLRPILPSVCGSSYKRWQFVAVVQLVGMRLAQYQGRGAHIRQEGGRQPVEVEVGKGRAQMDAWPAVRGTEYVAVVGNDAPVLLEGDMTPAGTWVVVGKRPEDRVPEDTKWAGTFASNKVSTMRKQTRLPTRHMEAIRQRYQCTYRVV